jgi:hemerythrin-like domain-containing protein
MKRNKNLIELSRDHHHGLLLGWKIKQGLKKQAAVIEIIKYVAYFAQEALFKHFEAEENQILVYLLPDDEHGKIVMKEHTEIRTLIQQLISSKPKDSAGLMRLAEVLEAHIRYEEREFFPYLESTLAADELEIIGKEIDHLHVPYIENYPHEFWAN